MSSNVVHVCSVALLLLQVSATAAMELKFTGANVHHHYHAPPQNSVQNNQYARFRATSGVDAVVTAKIVNPNNCPDPHKPAETVADLIGLLQTAILVEYATIPPYLDAWFSLKDPKDAKFSAILDVAVQEMGHLTLAANMVSALGGTPRIAIPTYPGPLPCGLGGTTNDTLTVNLGPLSAQQLKTFLRIEEPMIMPNGQPTKDHTLGMFYVNINDSFVSLHRRGLLPDFQTENQQQGPGSGLQSTSPLTADGNPTYTILNFENALRAIDTIVIQGEGVNYTTCLDGNGAQQSHYCIFKALSNEPLPPINNWPSDPQTHNMHYTSNQTGVSLEFDKLFSTMTDLLHCGFTQGGPKGASFIQQAVGQMRGLTTYVNGNMGCMPGACITPAFEAVQIQSAC